MLGMLRCQFKQLPRWHYPAPDERSWAPDATARAPSPSFRRPHQLCNDAGAGVNSCKSLRVNKNY